MNTKEDLENLYEDFLMMVENNQQTVTPEGFGYAVIGYTVTLLLDLAPNDLVGMATVTASVLEAMTREIDVRKKEKKDE